MAATAARIQLTLYYRNIKFNNSYVIEIMSCLKRSPEDSEDPLEVSHLEDVERVADGEVPLERERHDRQHRRIRSAGKISFMVIINAIGKGN